MTEENVTSLKYSFEFVNTNWIAIRGTEGGWQGEGTAAVKIIALI